MVESARIGLRPPILVVGAARSGTKLLRSLLAVHPDVSAVEYDINYIWRHGNESVSHDELSPEHARPEMVEYVWRYFRRHQGEGMRAVEKTVSNSLRLNFCRAVFPDAHVIILLRDGYDVVESSMRMWQTPPDIGYMLRKSRQFPLRDAPGYALRYGVRYLKPLRRRGRVPLLGPSLRGHR